MNSYLKHLDSHMDNRSYAPGYSYKYAPGQYALDSVDADRFKIDEARMAVYIPFASGLRRDGVGDLLEVSGIETDRHRLNPIVLFDHGKQITLPIAVSEDPKTKSYTVELDPSTRTGGAWAFFYGSKGVDSYSNYDHALFCEQVFDMMAKRFIRGGSIGYTIIEARELPPDYRTGIPAGLHLIRTKMLELSAVILPANADTVSKSLRYWHEARMDLAREVLSMPKICGRPPSPYLVKSLQDFVHTKAVVRPSRPEDRIPRTTGSGSINNKQPIQDQRRANHKRTQRLGIPHADPDPYYGDTTEDIDTIGEVGPYGEQKSQQEYGANPTNQKAQRLHSLPPEQRLPLTTRAGGEQNKQDGSELRASLSGRRQSTPEQRPYSPAAGRHFDNQEGEYEAVGYASGEHHPYGYQEDTPDEVDTVGEVGPYGEQKAQLHPLPYEQRGVGTINLGGNQNKQDGSEEAATRAARRQFRDMGGSTSPSYINDTDNIYREGEGLPYGYQSDEPDEVDTVGEVGPYGEQKAVHRIGVVDKDQLRQPGHGQYQDKVDREQVWHGGPVDSRGYVTRAGQAGTIDYPYEVTHNSDLGQGPIREGFNTQEEAEQRARQVGDVLRGAGEQVVDEGVRTQEKSIDPVRQRKSINVPKLVPKTKGVDNRIYQRSKQNLNDRRLLTDAEVLSNDYYGTPDEDQPAHPNYGDETPPYDMPLAVAGGYADASDTDSDEDALREHQESIRRYQEGHQENYQTPPRGKAIGRPQSGDRVTYTRPMANPSQEFTVVGNVREDYPVYDITGVHNSIGTGETVATQRLRDETGAPYEVDVEPKGLRTPQVGERVQMNWGAGQVDEGTARAVGITNSAGQPSTSWGPGETAMYLNPNTNLRSVTGEAYGSGESSDQTNEGGHDDPPYPDVPEGQEQAEFNRHMAQARGQKGRDLDETSWKATGQVSREGKLTPGVLSGYEADIYYEDGRDIVRAPIEENQRWLEDREKLEQQRLGMTVSPQDRAAQSKAIHPESGIDPEDPNTYRTPPEHGEAHTPHSPEYGGVRVGRTERDAHGTGYTTVYPKNAGRGRDPEITASGVPHSSLVPTNELTDPEGIPFKSFKDLRNKYRKKGLIKRKGSANNKQEEQEYQERIGQMVVQQKSSDEEGDKGEVRLETVDKEDISDVTGEPHPEGYSRGNYYDKVDRELMARGRRHRQVDSDGGLDSRDNRYAINVVKPDGTRSTYHRMTQAGAEVAAQNEKRRLEEQEYKVESTSRKQKSVNTKDPLGPGRVYKNPLSNSNVPPPKWRAGAGAIKSGEVEQPDVTVGTVDRSGLRTYRNYETDSETGQRVPGSEREDEFYLDKVQREREHGGGGYKDPKIRDYSLGQQPYIAVSKGPHGTIVEGASSRAEVNRIADQMEDVQPITLTVRRDAHTVQEKVFKSLRNKYRVKRSEFDKRVEDEQKRQDHMHQLLGQDDEISDYVMTPEEAVEYAVSIGRYPNPSREEYSQNQKQKRMKSAEQLKQNADEAKIRPVTGEEHTVPEPHVSKYHVRDRRNLASRGGLNKLEADMQTSGIPGDYENLSQAEAAIDIGGHTIPFKTVDQAKRAAQEHAQRAYERGVPTEVTYGAEKQITFKSLRTKYRKKAGNVNQYGEIETSTPRGSSGASKKPKNTAGKEVLLTTASPRGKLTLTRKKSEYDPNPQPTDNTPAGYAQEDLSENYGTKAGVDKSLDTSKPVTAKHPRSGRVLEDWEVDAMNAAPRQEGERVRIHSPGNPNHGREATIDTGYVGEKPHSDVVYDDNTRENWYNYRLADIDDTSKSLGNAVSIQEKQLNALAKFVSRLVGGIKSVEQLKQTADAAKVKPQLDSSSEEEDDGTPEMPLITHGNYTNPDQGIFTVEAMDRGAFDEGRNNAVPYSDLARQQDRFLSQQEKQLNTITKFINALVGSVKAQHPTPSDSEDDGTPEMLLQTHQPNYGADDGSVYRSFHERHANGLSERQVREQREELGY